MKEDQPIDSSSLSQLMEYQLAYDQHLTEISRLQELIAQEESKLMTILKILRQLEKSSFIFVDK